jgi:hypothetical protein
MTYQSDKTRKWHDDCLKGVVGPRYADHPAEGEYRCYNKDKTAYPVYFWYDRTHPDAPLRCHVNGKSVSEEAALRIWEYCGTKNVISSEAYWHRMDTGEWLDNDAAAAQAAKGPEIDPGINGANAEESLKLEISKAVEAAKAYDKIESDEAAARAQTLRSVLTTLKGSAQKKYESLSQPLLDEISSIRRTWFPLRNGAASVADRIRKAQEAWNDVKLTATRKAEAEAKRKADEQNEEARAKYDREAAAALVAGELAPEPPTPVIVAPIVNTPPPSTQIKGASGRTASVTAKEFIKEIDVEKAFLHFKTHFEVHELLTRLCQAALTAGIRVDGITTEERSVIPR